MVLRLHKILSKDEVYLSDSDGETDYNRQTIENMDAVAFEPSLFTNLMIHPWIWNCTEKSNWRLEQSSIINTFRWFNQNHRKTWDGFDLTINILNYLQSFNKYF